MTDYINRFANEYGLEIEEAREEVKLDTERAVAFKQAFDQAQKERIQRFIQKQSVAKGLTQSVAKGLTEAKGLTQSVAKQSLTSEEKALAKQEALAKKEEKAANKAKEAAAKAEAALRPQP